MFGLGKLKVSCSGCGEDFRISREEQGAGCWVQCPNCGAKITVQSAGGFIFQGSIRMEEFEPGPSILDVRWLNVFGVTIPTTTTAAHARVKGILNPIEKSLGSVFINFPPEQTLSDDRLKTVYAAIYHSEFFKDIPFGSGDRWDSVQLPYDLQLKIIRLVKGFLSTSEWSSLRVRNLAGLKNRYAAGFIEVSFACPHCAQKLEVDADGEGMTIACPTCGSSLTIPPPSPKSPKPKVRRPRKPRVAGSDFPGHDTKPKDTVAGLHPEQKE
jgi:DNA-directed RNA polymerase subunit RPC12/RpoP